MKTKAIDHDEFTSHEAIITRFPYLVETTTNATISLSMPEMKQGGRKEPSIDPIAFEDEKIFGLDPAVHWLRWNNQTEQFPEIVIEITKHWDDEEWLTKLLNRFGYTADLYDPRQSIPGIFANPPLQERAKLVGIRSFLLRAAGVSSEKVRQMFGGNSQGSQWRFASFSVNEVVRRRKELASKSK